MKQLLTKANAYFDSPLDLRSRVVILIATVALLLPTYFVDLWQMEMYANQYPEGLRLYIYSYKLDAGNNGIDLREINTLNHYIGMAALDPKDFTEFKWLPFLVGFFIIFGLRTVVLGRVTQLVDQLVMFTYFGIFSAWSFIYKLYVYGHTLDPMAAVKVQPFTPPIIGHKTLANFEVYSNPGIASYCLALYPACLLLAAWFAYKSHRKAG